VRAYPLTSPAVNHAAGTAGKAIGVGIVIVYWMVVDVILAVSKAFTGWRQGRAIARRHGGPTSGDRAVARPVTASCLVIHVLRAA
jgi:hypothetical protein